MGPISWLKFVIIVLAVAAGCSQEKKVDGDDVDPIVPGELSISVSWAANREKDVNSSGGGYKVFYSVTAGVNTTTNPYYIDVPYVSGAAAPVTATIPNLSAGTYYIRVVAYSSYNPLGTSGGNRSAASSEVSITIP